MNIAQRIPSKSRFLEKSILVQNYILSSILFPLTQYENFRVRKYGILLIKVPQGITFFFAIHVLIQKRTPLLWIKLPMINYPGFLYIFRTNQFLPETNIRNRHRVESLQITHEQINSTRCHRIKHCYLCSESCAPYSPSRNRTPWKVRRS